MDAVNRDGWSLQFASEDTKRDRDILMAAVKQYGDALKSES